MLDRPKPTVGCSANGRKKERKISHTAAGVLLFALLCVYFDGVFLVNPVPLKVLII